MVINPYVGGVIDQGLVPAICEVCCNVKGDGHIVYVLLDGIHTHLLRGVSQIATSRARSSNGIEETLLVLEETV